MSMQEIDWALYGEMVELLVAAVVARHRTANFSDIIALTAGGMLPATALVHCVPHLHLHVWDVRRYKPAGVGAPLGEPKIRTAPSPFRRAGRVPGSGVVIMDHAVNEGATAAAVMDRIEQQADEARTPLPRPIVIATLYAAARHQHRCAADGDMIAVSWKSNDTTIIFPYEK